MTALTLVNKLRARGVEIVTDGSRLGVRPAGMLTTEEHEELRQYKTEVLALLAERHVAAPLRLGSPGFSESVAHVLGLPLDAFAESGELLEVRVSWLPVTLWFVPEERDVPGLVKDGISRGRIWTAAELADLLNIPNLTLAEVQTIAGVKIEFDGDVVEVRPGG